jgi:hypothetical protein
MTSFRDVIEYMKARYTLSGGGVNWVELWWKLTIDGERVVQHQIVYIDEVPEGLAILIDSDVHCLDPEHVPWASLGLSLGALGFDGGRPVLWQPVVAPQVDPAHLDRVLEAAATEAARLAREARLAA